MVSDTGDTSDDEDDELAKITCSQGIYSNLSGCSDPLTVILDQLTSPSLLPALVSVLRSRGLSSVGHLANLTEHDVNSLPIRSPKLTVMLEVLKKYDKSIRYEGVSLHL